MQEIIIDEEFRSLLPTLDKDTYALLEKNILEHGCRDALVTWNGILIDGYNRFSICVEHNISFTTVSKEFDSREEVLIWIISNQVSRRNLTPIQLSYFRGLHYRSVKKIVKNLGGKNQFSEVKAQNEPKARELSTASNLANQYRVSSMTIKRDAKLAEAISAIGEISPESQRQILSGEVRIDKKTLNKLSAESKEDLKELATNIENGTYEKKRNRKASADANGSGVAQPASGAPDADQMTIGGFADSNTETKHPLEKSIIEITDKLLADVRNKSIQSNSSAMKTSLRNCIDKLEDLYKQI